VNEDEDKALVRQCRAGDRQAFEALVRRYQKPVYNAALRLLHDPEDARDVAQTAFLKAYEHLADYEPGYKFYSWLYRIAINEALNVLSSRKPRGESADEADESAGPEQRAEGEQMSRAIELALQELKPELRTVIVLRHFMQLSYQDMGEILTLPEKTVKSRLFSARQLLREQLAHQGIS